MILAPGQAKERDMLLMEALEFQPCAPSEVRPEEYTGVDTRSMVWDQAIESL